jgi:hypothetical protein
MIKEQYVSFEVAKLLKEKGFKEETHGNYYLGGKFDGKFEESSKVNWNKFFKTPIAAPTQQMAMRWLREVHDIHCDVHLSFSENPKNYPPGYYIYILNTKDGNTVENPGNDISEIHPLYINKSCTPRNYHTYEDAVEAAIRYCLENLVK